MVLKMKMQQQTGSNCAIAGSSVWIADLWAIENIAANGNGHAGSPEINGNCTGTAETFLTGEDMRFVYREAFLIISFCFICFNSEPAFLRTLGGDGDRFLRFWRAPNL